VGVLQRPYRSQMRAIRLLRLWVFPYSVDCASR